MNACLVYGLGGGRRQPERKPFIGLGHIFKRLFEPDFIHVPGLRPCFFGSPHESVWTIMLRGQLILLRMKELWLHFVRRTKLIYVKK